MWLLCWRVTHPLCVVLQAVGVHGSGAAAWPVFPADQRCHLPRRGSATGRGWGSLQSCSSVPKASSRGHEQAHRDLPGEALCKYSCPKGLTGISCCFIFFELLFLLSVLKTCIESTVALFELSTDFNVLNFMLSAPDGTIGQVGGVP